MNKEQYPSKEVYYDLYKRFQSRDPYELVNYYQSPLDQKSILDVCAGNGRLSQSIVDKGHKSFIYLLDKEITMLPEIENSGFAGIYSMDVYNFIEEYYKDEKFDVIFCQQAINYWLKHVDIEKFSKMFKQKGQFIFNTFNKKPGTFSSPTIKEYEIGNDKFLEISYIENKRVYHIQIMNNQKPHLTSFDWLSDKKINKLLSPYFDIKKYVDGTTSIYNCFVR